MTDGLLLSFNFFLPSVFTWLWYASGCLPCYHLGNPYLSVFVPSALWVTYSKCQFLLPWVTAGHCAGFPRDCVAMRRDCLKLLPQCSVALILYSQATTAQEIFPDVLEAGDAFCCSWAKQSRVSVLSSDSSEKPGIWQAGIHLYVLSMRLTVVSSQTGVKVHFSFP